MRVSVVAAVWFPFRVASGKGTSDGADFERVRFGVVVTATAAEELLLAVFAAWAVPVLVIVVDPPEKVLSSTTENFIVWLVSGLVVMSPGKKTTRLRIPS